jgi:hypothetical protein
MGEKEREALMEPLLPKIVLKGLGNANHVKTSVMSGSSSFLDMYNYPPPSFGFSRAGSPKMRRRDLHEVD